jgi:NDP-hexose 4-ketoreductase
VDDDFDLRPRILVLGAAGFIGSHVARLIASERAENQGIFVTRWRNNQNRFPALGQWAWFNLVEGSELALGRLLEHLGPEVVVNCTGATHGSPDQMKQLNVGVVEKLVSVLTMYSSAHLVHLGSAAEYGPPEDWAPARESAEARPTSDYAATKLAGTEIVREAAESGRISATVLRVFNPVGAGAPPSSLVGRAAMLLREATACGDQRVTLGNLDGARDFIDVRDVARAVLFASRRPSCPRQAVILNVGRGIPVSSRWMVHRLAAIAHFQGEIAEEVTGSSRSGTVPWQWADTAAVRRELGWAPRYLLSDALHVARSPDTRPRDVASPFTLVPADTSSGAAPCAVPLPATHSILNGDAHEGAQLVR